MPITSVSIISVLPSTVLRVAILLAIRRVAIISEATISVSILVRGVVWYALVRSHNLKCSHTTIVVGCALVRLQHELRHRVEPHAHLVSIVSLVSIVCYLY